jgi:hypothetical protein
MHVRNYSIGSINDAYKHEGNLCTGMTARKVVISSQHVNGALEQSPPTSSMQAGPRHCIVPGWTA